MPHVVTQSCCADASCVVACPVNCIHPTPGEPAFATAEMLYVDAATCVDCGACVTACPVEAIKPHTILTAGEQPFLGINAGYYDVFPHRDRRPLAVIEQQRRLRRPGPFRVAVVGAGPAGLYTADELLRHPEVSVDVFDRLPTPYGLVRAGVAPDHPHTKRVTTLFGQIERQRRFRYLLDVEIGRDLLLADLEAHYDAVVYSVGAAADRSIGIDGEQLPGSLSATDLVGWYNAHPDKQHLPVPLDTERAVVVGNGNVALDVARVLTADPDALARTDVGGVALRALAASSVREVVVLGRRGPVQAAFTVPELVGLAALRDVDVVVEADPALLAVDEHTDPLRAPALRLLTELAARPRRAGHRAIVLRFCTAPVRILGDPDTGVTGVEVVRNRLEADAEGRVVAVPTEATEVIETGLVLRSVGYHGLPVTDLPYDQASGTVPNERGRVRPGVYVAGWVKRGPTGFIGTNKADAEQTVETLLDDLDSGAAGAAGREGRPGQTDPDGLERLLAERCPRAIGLAGWRAIDAEERRRGSGEGRPRAKAGDVAELRRIAAEAPVAPARPRRRARGGRLTGTRG